jgi:hypothetical protein
MLEQQLQRQGYSIKGDTATKETGSGKGFQGFLSSVFGALMGDNLELPPEGEVDEFLEIARLTLNGLPGWPPPRSVALRNCVKPAPASRSAADRRPQSPPQLRVPKASAPPVVRPRPQARAVKQAHEPPTWMQDFIGAHRRPDSQPSRLTSTSGQNYIVSTVSSTKGKPSAHGPEWMKDFTHTSTTSRTGDKKGSKTSEKPEWMEDFE